MLFSKKPTTLLVLYRNLLRVYIGEAGDASDLEFPEEVVHNLEVLDPGHLESIISDALLGSGLKPQNAILLLSDEVLFQKTIFNAEGPLSKIQIDDFYKNVPLNPGELAKLEVKGDSQIYLFAANRLLFQLIVSEFEKEDWNILSVTPLSFYGQFQGREVLESTIVLDILDSYKAELPLSFLNFEEESMAGQELQKKKDSPILTIVLIGIFLLAVLGTLFLLVTTRSKKAITSTPAKEVQVEPTPSPQEVPSTTPLSTAVKKEDVKVKVLNGSGIPGEATKIKELLTQKGYTNIETGNAQSSASAALMEVKEDLPQEYKDEILAQLHDLFVDITLEDIEATLFDVVITTSK